MTLRVKTLNYCLYRRFLFQLTVMNMKNNMFIIILAIVLVFADLTNPLALEEMAKSWRMYRNPGNTSMIWLPRFLKELVPPK
jgi:hypothetical protein